MIKLKIGFFYLISFTGHDFSSLRKSAKHPVINPCVFTKIFAAFTKSRKSVMRVVKSVVTAVRKAFECDDVQPPAVDARVIEGVVLQVTE